MVRLRDRGQAGQALPLIVVFMMTLLGMCGLAIDVSSWYLQKSKVQAAADAAALAGASQLPAGWSYAQSAASAEYTKNGNAGDSVTITNTANLTAGDSVTVTASRVASSYFTRLFGYSGTTVRGTARATVESVVGYASKGNVMPWGIMRGAYTAGTTYPMEIDNSSSPQSGALDIPYETGCAGGAGSSDYRNLINGGTTACPLEIGDLLGLQSGSINGPTRQGIDDRVPITQTADQIVSFGPNGTATVIDPTSKQLVLIPVIENSDGTTNWPSGSGQVRIVGFAWFVLTGYHARGVRLYVDGVFVSMGSSDPNSTLGAWSHLVGGATAIELTA